MKTTFIKNSLNIYITLYSFYQNDFFFIKNEPKEINFNQLSAQGLRINKFVSKARLPFLKQVVLKKLSSSFSLIRVCDLETFYFQYKKFKRENNLLFLFSKLKSL